MLGHTTTRVWLLTIVLASFALAPAVQAGPLAIFPPSKWGCDLGNQKALQGINAGLIAEGWRLTGNDKKGHLVAELDVRGKHKLMIDITYTDSTYEISYKDSENLKYKVGDAGPTIHGNANKWMRKVNEMIGLQLNALCSL